MKYKDWLEIQNELSDFSPIEMQKLYIAATESKPFKCLSCGKTTTRQGTERQPCIHCGTLHDIQATFYSGYDVVVLSKETEEVEL